MELPPEQMARAFGRAVFLSHVNAPDMPVFPGDPAPVFRQICSVETHGFALQTVTMGEHSGTHWGAPGHFHDGEARAHDLPAASFVLPAVVLDIRNKTAKDPDYALCLEDILVFEQAHGRILPHSMVIAFTGWQELWSDPEAYLNMDAHGVLHYPGIGRDAAKWLVDERQIGGLGSDTHGIDPGADQTKATNTLLLQGARIHLENLAGLQQLPPIGAWIVVGGMRNRNGSGGQATVFGFLP